MGTSTSTRVNEKGVYGNQSMLNEKKKKKKKRKEKEEEGFHRCNRADGGEIEKKSGCISITPFQYQVCLDIYSSLSLDLIILFD